MELSKEILDIVVVILPGLFAFVIAEALAPNKVEFNRSIVYTIALSALSFLSATIFWKLYYKLSYLLKFGYPISNIVFTNNIFSFHSNFYFALLVFMISILLGFTFAWAINNHLIYKLMNKLGASNMASKLEVWDDFFATQRENSFVVVRDISNDLMYYGNVNYYSIGTATKMTALHLTDVDVYTNKTAQKLYNVNELYLPFHSESMTVEFPKILNSQQRK